MHRTFVFACHALRGAWIQRWRRGGWALPACCLLLALTWAGPAKAAKPAPQATPEPNSPTIISLDLTETLVWGTVRAVLDGTNLVVVTPEITRFDIRLLGIETPELPRQGAGDSSRVHADGAVRALDLVGEGLQPLAGRGCLLQALLERQGLRMCSACSGKRQQCQ